ncbi:S46 family peptidase [Massilia sp. YMA4]|uniref:S46 family peptidase n=1 Tax=Massilia sp. YMA4 TaxID=1593482 RepID=UPI001D0CA48A|nr:S46 family peptidase [Massilia sp. YMA4]
MRKEWLACLGLYTQLSYGAEGMWTFNNLPLDRIKSEYNVTLDPAWVRKVMLSSARIEGTCSASFVSKDGLVMTNHHCASECIEQLSTAQKNYLTDGFLARRRSEELVCPDIALTRLEQITDVTARMQQATAGLDGPAYKKAENAARAELASACIGERKDKVHCEVINLYQGGMYQLYRYHRYPDVRLVWAPEKSVAFFGGDPDNFQFPRYNLDVTMLRAYEDGKPAKLDNYFTFSKDALAENDPVFVPGMPARTRRQMSVAQVAAERDVYLMSELLRTARLAGIIQQYGSTSAEAARTSETLLFDLENAYKQMHGELETLMDPAFLARKQKEEDALRAFVAADPALRDKVGGAWDAIAAAQQTYREIGKRYWLLERATAFNGLYFRFARFLVRGADERVKPNTERLAQYSTGRIADIEREIHSTGPVYAELEQVRMIASLTRMRDMLGTDDPLVRRVLGSKSPEQLVADMVARTKMGDASVRAALWKGGQEAVAASDDPFIQLARSVDLESRQLRARYEREVEAVTQKNNELIAHARFAHQGTKVYPDGTFSLRLSYGQVKGWNADGVEQKPFTDFAGIFARHTGAAPFALPASWLTARDGLPLTQPFNFVTTNDIVGGNSGSPVINRRGEIVGLAFDANIHAIGSGYWYDERNNRAIAVDGGAILTALKSVYHADALLKELGR